MTAARGGLALALLAGGVAALFLGAGRETRRPGRAVGPVGPVDTAGDPLPHGAVARIGVARFRPLTAGAGFTADGRSIVGGARDGFVHVFDAETGIEKRKFAAHTDATAALGSKSPQGSKLAPGLTHLGVVGFAMSPDGTQAATVGRNQVRVWDVATGARIADWPVNGVPQVVWLPDGSGGWATSAGIVRWRLDAPGAPGSPGVAMPYVSKSIGQMGTPPQSARFAAVGHSEGAGSVTIVDVAGATERTLDGTGAFGNVRESPDGTRLALVSGKPSVVRVLDAASLREIARFPAPSATSWCAGWAPDGTSFVLSSADATHLVAAADGRVLETIPVAQAFNVTWSPTRPRAVVRTLGAVAVLDTKSWTRIDVTTDVVPDAYAFLPDSHTLVVGTATGIAHWDADTGRRLAEVPALEPAPVAYRMDAGGRLVLAWDHKGYRVLDAATGDVLSTGVNPKATSSWVFGARGRTPLVLVDAELQPALIGPGGASTPVGGVRSGARHVAFLASGERFLFAAPGGVTIHDATTGARVGTLGLLHVPNGVAPAADGRRVAVSSEDGVLRVLSAANGTVVWQHTVPASTWGPPMALSPDGSRLAWADDDAGGVRLVDLAPDAPKDGVALAGHLLRAQALAFSHDGRLLASGGGEGTILVWDVNTALGR